MIEQSLREAVVLTGRCLAYGGDALGPLAEMVNQAAGDTTPRLYSICFPTSRTDGR